MGQIASAGAPPRPQCLSGADRHCRLTSRAAEPQGRAPDGDFVMNPSADHSALAAVIDKAWDNRADVSPATRGEVRDAIDTTLALLDSGKLRVAEKVPGKTGRES